MNLQVGFRVQGLGVQSSGLGVVGQRLRLIWIKARL